jgi:hypothetical protein
MELAIAGVLVVVMLYAGFRMEPLLVLVDAPARALGLRFGHV